ncbi:MAG TPA: DUF6612 family protein [Actinomycetota bacterium]|nr:DUF6612 family protein [Actinomycetota bacterium]
MKRFRIVRLLSVLAVFALVLAACSSGPGTVSDDGPEPGQAPGGQGGGNNGDGGGDPVALIRAVTAKVENAGAYRATFGMAITAQGQTIEATGEGEFSDDPLQVHTTYRFTDMPGVEGDFEMEMILDGSVMYMRSPMLSRSPGLDTDWISMDLDELVPGFSDLASLSQGQNDPTAQLEYLRGISDAQEVGTERVAGVETTHYSGTVDLDAAYDRLPDDTRGELKQAIAQARKQFGHGAMPVDVWIDGDGLLRRMTMSLESGGNSAVDFGMEMTMEIPEYGIAMHLPIPKAGDVTDVSDLLPSMP